MKNKNNTISNTPQIKGSKSVGPILYCMVALLILYSLFGIARDLDEMLKRTENQEVALVDSSRYGGQDLEDFKVDPNAMKLAEKHGLECVPIYSHIWYRNGTAYPLESTVSIRNLDPRHKLFLKAVDYFDTEGKLVERYLDRAIMLNPLQTIEFLVDSHESPRGAGANILIEWSAENEANKPMTEAVMIGTKGPHGICCFKSAGHGIPLIPK